MRRAISLLALLFACCAAQDAELASPFLPVRVRVSPSFRFVGSQTFVLREVAEVEQHLYAIANGGEVERLVWIQFERYLPHVDSQYAYPKERVTSLGGLEFDLNVRAYDKPPDAGSDRARAYELLAAHGLRFGIPATRVRLVHVPDNNRRAEVMIIYAERGSPSGDEALARALNSVTVR